MTQNTSPLATLKDPSLLKTDALINGEWIAGASRFAVHDPATGAKLTDVANLGAQDAKAAIAAANAAWPAWRSKTAKERSSILRKWFDLLMANQDDLGRIMTAEQGKPLPEAKGEVAYGASFVEWFAEEAKRVNGETLPQFDNNKRLLVLKQPIGVCAAITPWNFPLAMITRKVAPALAAGCTVVLKPSEVSPLSALIIAEILHDAGVPAGVFNLVNGDGAGVGAHLSSHPDVEMISFTGSTRAGRAISKAAAETLKRVTLELGGKSPNIVFEDADLDDAVKGATSGIFAATGQTCLAGSRLLLHESIHDAFLDRLSAVAKTARMGNPMEPDTQIGPVTTPPQFEKILHFIDVARSEGARLVAGGNAARRPECGNGWFVEPTIFADVTNDMTIAREEVFGPVLAIIRAPNVDQALDIENASPYGNAASVFTESGGVAHRVMERASAGMIGVNVGVPVPREPFSFGGWNESKFGVGDITGRGSIEFWTESKKITTKWNREAGVNWMS